METTPLPPARSECKCRRPLVSSSKLEYKYSPEIPSYNFSNLYSPPNISNIMQFSTLILAASASLASMVSAGQVNFYSDTNCNNYIGEAHPGSFQTTG